MALADRTIVNLTPGEWGALQLVPAKKRLQALAGLCAMPFPRTPEIRVRYDPRDGAYGTRWHRFEQLPLIPLEVIP